MKEQFRVVQLSEKNFRIQKKFIRTKTTGYLWWKEINTTEEWCTIDAHGREIFIRHLITNFNLIEEYKTLEKAKEWIENRHKYPIYFYEKAEK